MRWIYLFIFSAFILFSAPANAQSPSVAQIEIEPNRQSVEPGQELRLEVSVISGDTRVNAVQLNLLFPPGKVEVVDIDTGGSDFPIQAQEKIENNIIKISRGNVEPQGGKSNIADITFRALQTVSADEITLSLDSAVMSENNENILTGSFIKTAESNKVAQLPPPQNEEVIVEEFDESSVETKAGEEDSLVGKIARFNANFWNKIFSIFNIF